MGFLLYAGRKLQLKNKINQLSYRQMMLSQEQQTIASQIADKQQAINAAKNQMNLASQMSIFNGVLNGLCGNDTVNTLLKGKGIENYTAQDLQALLNNQAIKNKNGEDVKFGENDFAAISQTYSTLQNSVQMQTALATNVMNSVLDATSKADLTVLNNKDSQISLELENIESQLKLTQAEYENCKKAESSEAQNTAPSFGLA